MKLNLFTDYAVRALMYLCWRRERTVTAEEIAKYYGVSRDHIVKVIQELSRRGFVRARRGRGGGSLLAREPNDVTIAEIVTAFEGKPALLECFRSTNVCSIETDCRLRGVLIEGQRRMMEYLESVTLADVAGVEPIQTVPLNGLGDA